MWFKRARDRINRFIDEELEAAAFVVAERWPLLVLLDAIGCTVAWKFGAGSWAIWAHILVLQNFAFTFVSRARNSASLGRHLKAALMSNGVWFISQIIIFTKLWDYISGKHGLGYALATGLFYTAFTMSGSIYAHAQALMNEKGKTAVGASKKYVQVTPVDFERIMRFVRFAENVYGDEVPREHKAGHELVRK
jgi:hypothetical protein